MKIAFRFCSLDGWRYGLLVVLALVFATLDAYAENCDLNDRPTRTLPNNRYTVHPFSPDIGEHFSGPARALAEAASCGNVDMVKRLIRQGTDPNQLSHQGMPLLLWPMYMNSLEGFTALLENGADPDIKTRDGTVLLHYVIESTGVEYVTAALRHSADPTAINPDKEPLLHIAQRVGKWDIVYTLIEAGAEVDAPDAGSHGESVLFFATGYGNFEQAYRLMSEYDAYPGYRIKRAPDPGRIGAQPILEQIFHRPLDGEKYPEAKAWQRKCQEFVLARGFEPPPVPEKWQ